LDHWTTLFAGGGEMVSPKDEQRKNGFVAAVDGESDKKVRTTEKQRKKRESHEKKKKSGGQHPNNGIDNGHNHTSNGASTSSKKKSNNAHDDNGSLTDETTTSDVSSRTKRIAEEERDVVKKLWAAAEKPPRCDKWYLVSFKWWCSWKLYVGYDGEGEGDRTSKRPNAIDNADLLLSPTASSSHEVRLSYNNYRYVLLLTIALQMENKGERQGEGGERTTDVETSAGGRV